MVKKFRRRYWITIVIFFFAVITLGIAVLIRLKGDGLGSFLLIADILIVYCFSCFAIYSNKKVRDEKEKKEQVFNSLEHRYTRTIRDVNENLDMFKSRMLALLDGIDERLIAHDCPEAKSYVQAQKQKCKRIFPKLYNFGNPVFSAIVDLNVLKCRNLGIEIDCFLETRMGQIRDEHLCVIFGNLIDNAIEGCQRQGEHEIIICSKKACGANIVSVRNKINTSVLESNPKLKTTKKNKKVHGMGLENVREALREYNGKLYILEDDSFFIVCIELPIK